MTEHALRECIRALGGTLVDASTVRGGRLHVAVAPDGCAWIDNHDRLLRCAPYSDARDALALRAARGVEPHEIGA